MCIPGAHLLSFDFNIFYSLKKGLSIYYHFILGWAEPNPTERAMSRSVPCPILLASLAIGGYVFGSISLPVYQFLSNITQKVMNGLRRNFMEGSGLGSGVVGVDLVNWPLWSRLNETEGNMGVMSWRDQEGHTFNSTCTGDQGVELWRLKL